MKILLTKLTCLFCLSFACYTKADQDLWFDSDGVDIHYSDTVSGQAPIVLIHGYTMDSGMWTESGIADKLAKQYRVISIDLRGHGKSDKPTATKDYGPKIGLDIINLLDHLKIPKAHMVGFSMGAFMLGRLLVTHPERIVSATLCSGFFPISSKEEQAFQEATAKDMEEDGDLHLASVARGWALDAVTPEQIAKIRVPIQAVFGGEEVNEFFDSQKELLELPKLSKPVLVIEGADHDSNRAAVLHPEFLKAAKALISTTN